MLGYKLFRLALQISWMKIHAVTDGHRVAVYMVYKYPTVLDSWLWKLHACPWNLWTPTVQNFAEGRSIDRNVHSHHWQGRLLYTMLLACFPLTCGVLSSWCLEYCIYTVRSLHVRTHECSQQIIALLDNIHTYNCDRIWEKVALRAKR